MTNVAEIFHKLKPDDPEFMLRAWRLFPLQDRRHLDLSLLPFVDAYTMYNALSLRELGLDPSVDKPERRRAESIQKKLKRAMIKPFPDRKNCRCPICLAWKETKEVDDVFLNGPGSDKPSGLFGKNCGVHPLTQQLPTRKVRLVESHIQGMKASLILLDDVTVKASDEIKDFAKAFKDFMDRVEKRT